MVNWLCPKRTRMFRLDVFLVRSEFRTRECSAVGISKGLRVHMLESFQMSASVPPTDLKLDVGRQGLYSSESAPDRRFDRFWHKLDSFPQQAIPRRHRVVEKRTPPAPASPPPDRPRAHPARNPFCMIGTFFVQKPNWRHACRDHLSLCPLEAVPVTEKFHPHPGRGCLLPTPSTGVHFSQPLHTRPAGRRAGGFLS